LPLIHAHSECRPPGPSASYALYFFAFSVFIGMAIAFGLQQEAWTGAVSGALFMGLLVIFDSGPGPLHSA
jgi:hypothetical protein